MAPRLTVALLLLALSAACGTTRVVRLDTGRGEPLEYRPPTSNKSVVDAGAFEEALTQLVLNEPLTLRPTQQGWLVRVSYSGNETDTRWRRLMSKSFGGLCEPGQRRDDCLSVLDDAMGLSEWDKLGVARQGHSHGFEPALFLDSSRNHHLKNPDGSSMAQYSIL